MKFILVIRGWFNIWESINEEQIIVIHHINRLKKKKSHMVMSKDPEKEACDKIQHYSL